MRRSHVILPVALAGLLAVTACSPAGGGNSSGANAAGEHLDHQDSPLAEFLGSSAQWEVSSEVEQAELDAWNAEVDELIAECMHDEGFEYVPLGLGEAATSGVQDRMRPDDRSWVEQWGYGVFTGRTQESDAAEDLQGDNPTKDLIASMSEAEYEAYSRALYGEEPTEEQLSDPEFDMDTLEQGCAFEASSAVEQVGIDYDEVWAPFEDLRTRLHEMHESVADSEGMVALDAEWASCMADEGYPGYTKQSDPVNELYDLKSELYAPLLDALDDVDLETASRDDTEEIREQTDPTGSAEWKEAAELEIALALADLTCREETDYASRSLQVQYAIEEEFIADNKAELEKLRAALESAS